MNSEPGLIEKIFNWLIIFVFAVVAGYCAFTVSKYLMWKSVQGNVRYEIQHMVKPEALQ